jgi:hypothetical protein
LKSAFSETVLTNVNEKPKFHMQVPSKLAVPYEQRKVDHLTNWKHVGKDSRSPKGTVHKRFLLDVGSDSFFFRNLRSFMIRKFIDAFIEMAREVELTVRGWHEGQPRFDESVCSQGGVSPGPQFWPKQGESVKQRVAEVIAELKSTSAIPMSPGPAPKGRDRKSSSMFLSVE